ncbi:MAG: DUF4124 domain-containing protein [Azonexaceae bacterium]|uniref:DUF4124 domain-containing protein n=1 Tax=Azonexus sp. R2A61 TaxID=2744443 RepID=UPI001F403472|nr:DUF4124 domain-containing protein [Azonexus sp. R2A61]MCE1240269.1 DUF4124 domain-containing protein [Azonexaceae bacterium]
MFRLFPLLLVLVVPAASAQVYKCRLPNGQTEITNKPCQGSATVEVRPEEKISESERLATERELARARAFIEQREALAERERAAESARQRQLASERPVAEAPRIYTGQEDCLRDIAARTEDGDERRRLEAECRRLPTVPVTTYVPYPVAVPMHRHPAGIETPPPTPQPRPPKVVEPKVPSIVFEPIKR